jgi:hypothetical protein
MTLSCVVSKASAAPISYAGRCGVYTCVSCREMSMVGVRREDSSVPVQPTGVRPSHCKELYHVGGESLKIESAVPA